MLKFIKGHLSSIGGIEIYPLISFLIFFFFFLAVILWAMKADKRFLSKMGNLPLDDNCEKNNPNDYEIGSK